MENLSFIDKKVFDKSVTIVVDIFQEIYRKNGLAHVDITHEYEICLDLKALYDATKKYHHGAEDGSLLGISWVNPNEVEYFDEVLQKIVTDIRTNDMVRELSA